MMPTTRLHVVTFLTLGLAGISWLAFSLGVAPTAAPLVVGGLLAGVGLVALLTVGVRDIAGAWTEADGRPRRDPQ